MKLICSSQQDFLSHTTKLINQFQKRWFNNSLNKQQIDKANLQDREELLNKKERHCYNYPFITQI